jgi:hypothetical protein
MLQTIYTVRYLTNIEPKSQSVPRVPITRHHEIRVTLNMAQCRATAADVSLLRIWCFEISDDIHEFRYDGPARRTDCFKMLQIA